MSLISRSYIHFFFLRVIIQKKDIYNKRLRTLARALARISYLELTLVAARADDSLERLNNVVMK